MYMINKFVFTIVLNIAYTSYGFEAEINKIKEIFKKEEGIPENPYPISNIEIAKAIEGWNHKNIYTYDDFVIRDLILNESNKEDDPLSDIDSFLFD